MALTLGDNFSYQGAKPLDSRIQFATVAAMKAYAEASLYNGCFAYITENKKYYTYDSSNTVDSTTGKWREFESGGGTDDYTDLQNKPQINSITLSGNKSLSDLGIAPANVADDCYKTGDTASTALEDADYIPFYDVSISSKRNTLWSNIKSVLKTYFDTLYSTVTTRGTPTSGGTALSLVNTGDLYNLSLATPTIKTATLPSGSTAVNFTDVPTTGDKLISISTSQIGLEYDSITQSGSTVAVYFPAQSSAVTVYMKIENT